MQVLLGLPGSAASETYLWDTFLDPRTQLAVLRMALGFHSGMTPGSAQGTVSDPEDHPGLT